MSDKKPAYKKEIIEVADIIFNNPDKKMSEIMRYFAEKCGRSQKTVERWISAAKKYNKNRLQEQEQIKGEVLTEQTKEAFKKGLLSRMEALEILAKIAKGQAREIPVKSILQNKEKKYVQWELQYPSDGERTKAITQLAKMEGWDAPQKMDIDLSQPVIIQKNYDRFNSKTDTGT
jgi:hypothetical protein